jgi:hypothetical protein
MRNGRRQKPLFVRMSDQLWRQLEADALRKGISHSELTRLLIMEHCRGEDATRDPAGAVSPKN